MTADCLSCRTAIPEWQRSGPFFLIALLAHAIVLFYPLPLIIGRLEMPPPGTVTVQLQAAPTPLPLAPPVAKPIPVPPTPAVSKSKPVPTPRPVLAMPAQTPVAPASFAVPLPVSVPPAAAAAAAAPAASNGALAAVVGARFDAAYLHNPRPNYPPISRRLGEEGKVVLRVKVSAEGLALTVDVAQGSSFERLDEVARATVARWRFVPARRGDEAVEALVLVPIVFRLDD